MVARQTPLIITRRVSEGSSSLTRRVVISTTITAAIWLLRLQELLLAASTTCESDKSAEHYNDSGCRFRDSSNDGQSPRITQEIETSKVITVVVRL